MAEGEVQIDGLEGHQLIDTEGIVVWRREGGRGRGRGEGLTAAREEKVGGREGGREGTYRGHRAYPPRRGP